MGHIEPSRAHRFRTAAATDAEPLAELERSANLAALGQVFPPEEHPFPMAEVLDRWRATVEDDDVTVEVVDGADGLLCFVAYDVTTLRHLAVRPSAWGTGLAGAAVRRAVAGIHGAGGLPRLWCLTDNSRALGLYAHLGWESTGATRTCPWPPYPQERELVLRGSTRE